MPRSSPPTLGTASVATSTYRVLLTSTDGAPNLFMGRSLRDVSPFAFELQHAHGTAEASRLVAAGAVDIVVAELGANQQEAVEELRRLKLSSREVPVVVFASDLRRNRVLANKLLAAGVEEAFDLDLIDDETLAARIMYVVERCRARAQHRQLLGLLDALPDAILVAHRTGRLRYVNEAAVDLFGRTRTDLLKEPLGFSARNGEPVELVIPQAKGSRVGEMRVVPIEWDGEVADLAAIRDVTERKNAEKMRARSMELERDNRRIQEESRLKAQFVANMSHELRTPLNAIIGFTELLIDRQVDPVSEQYDAFLSHIWNAGKHLLGLIDEVLDLAKLDSGRIEFRPILVELEHVVGEVIELSSQLARDKRVMLVAELDPRLTHVELDPQRLQQTLYNYISNALKFTSDGRVVVRTRLETEQHFRIEVEDTGIGIAPEDIGKLFVEFQQLEAGAAKRHRGTGLGLALTKRMVEAQGGRVGVTSVVGQGSIFFAVLPIVARRQEA